MDDDNSDSSVAIGAVLLVAAILGCFIAALLLAKDFFRGKLPSTVLVGALTLVDFIGAFSSSVFVFHGFVRGDNWLGGFPQCEFQGFFTTTAGLSSGAVVASMALERALALGAPYFYRKHVTTGSTRIVTMVITLACAVVSVLPFAGIGRYTFNERSKSFCHFDWFSSALEDRIFVCICGFMGAGIILMMLASNAVVFVIVVRMKRARIKVLPRNASQRKQRERTVGQEQRMAKFVAIVSCTFLVTWLPVTVRLFCNVLGVFQSPTMDSLSLRLVAVNFILDPFSYVFLRKSFKKNVLRSFRTVWASLRHKSGVVASLERSVARCDSDIRYSDAYFVTGRRDSRWFSKAEETKCSE